MKPVIAIALASLLGAVVFALLPAEAPPPQQAPLGPVLADATPATSEDEPDNDPVALLQGEPLPEEEGGGEVVMEEGALAEVWVHGRVTPQSGAQPSVQLIAQIDCPPETPICEQEILDAEVDEDTGEFSIALYPGTWRLVARASGFLPAHEEGLALTAHEELGDVVMTLEPGERITGTVTEENEPRESVQVVAIGQGYTRLTLTDEFGHYELEGLPRGSYTVRAYHSGYGGDQKQALSGSTVDLSLGHREKVQGRVLDTRGMPVEGAIVYSDWSQVAVTEADPFPTNSEGLYGLGAHGCAPSPSCYQRAVTGVDGRFELEGAPGEALVIGAAHGKTLALVTGVLPGGDARDVTLELQPTPALKPENDESEANVEVEEEPAAEDVNEISIPPPPFFTRAQRADGQGWVTIPFDGFDRPRPPRHYVRIKEPIIY